MTRTPSNAVTLPLLIADVGFRVAGLAAGSAALVALAPVPLFAGTASSDPAITGAVPTIVSSDIHSHLLNFDIKMGSPSSLDFENLVPVKLFATTAGPAQTVRGSGCCAATEPGYGRLPESPDPVRLPHHQTGERKDIGLEGHHNSHQSCQR